MAIQSNFMVKVKNAKLKDILDALKEKGIEVISVAEIFKEEIPDGDQKQA